MTIYERALDFIADGDVVGLGSGHASTAFIRLLGERVKAGLRVRGVPTSEGSAQVATEAGIPLISLEEGIPLAVDVDGADEVAPNLDLIKGYGRALLREKVVAVASRKLVILVGPGKEVRVLGERHKLPVEVVPFALPLCCRRLHELQLEPVPWEDQDQLCRTDNGNYILDCRLTAIHNPAELEQQIVAIPGVVGTGLFLGMADTILIGDDQFRLVAEKTRSRT